MSTTIDIINMKVRALEAQVKRLEDENRHLRAELGMARSTAPKPPIESYMPRPSFFSQRPTFGRPQVDLNYQFDYGGK
jgi:hypothetical protein